MSFKELLNRILFRLQGRVIRLHQKGATRGRVLISYTTLSFLNTSEESLSAHSNRWECKNMAEAFLERGYSVDVIDITNKEFLPSQKYTFCIDNYGNLERFLPFLNSDCVKVLHITSSHWRVNNEAEEKRLKDIEKRRGILLPPERILAPERGIEVCNIASMIGNTATRDSYTYAKKEVVLMSVTTTQLFPFPEHKDLTTAKKNFIWCGGAGLAHKGLDLVLEAFSHMPQYNLTVCGKINPNEPFARAYKRELYETKNIKTLGWLDPGSSEFKEMCEGAMAIVYPSCAEGQAGSVVLAMHAGLIPIVSRESGVNVENFGTLLEENTISNIEKVVTEFGAMSEAELRERSKKTWEYARTHHTREIFAKTYRDFVTRLESMRKA